MWNFAYEKDFADETIDNNEINNEIFGQISLTTNKTWMIAFTNNVIIWPTQQVTLFSGNNYFIIIFYVR